jgi:hypothetical protein
LGKLGREDRGDKGTLGEGIQERVSNWEGIGKEKWGEGKRRQKVRV